MSVPRQQICRQTAASLSSAAGSIPRIKSLIGLDGFVDEIIAVVDKRHSRESYEPVKTIDLFGKKILNAVGASSNYELVIKQMKLGGNGPIMANALAAIGLGVTYIGNLGYPAVHPVFEELTKRAKVISIAEPGHTDALEFDNGKLMLGKHQTLGNVNWENLVARAGKDNLRSLMRDAQLIGMMNWTMLPHMSDIWRKMLTEIPEIQNPTLVLSRAEGSKIQNPKHLFIDLADPEKRTLSDIREALSLLGQFQQHIDVTLGLNLKESSEVAEVLGIHLQGDAEASIEKTASAIRQKLNLSCVVIHPRKGAAAATADRSASFAGPFVQVPKISTGAGDHFNAGFCLGRILELPLEQCLCAGVATSGYYVRTAISPSAMQLADFLGQLPPPQE